MKQRGNIAKGGVKEEENNYTSQAKAQQPMKFSPQGVTTVTAL